MSGPWTIKLAPYHPARTVHKEITAYKLAFAQLSSHIKGESSREGKEVRWQRRD